MSPARLRRSRSIIRAAAPPTGKRGGSEPPRERRGDHVCPGSRNSSEMRSTVSKGVRVAVRGGADGTGCSARQGAAHAPALPLCRPRPRVAPPSLFGAGPRSSVYLGRCRAPPTGVRHAGGAGGSHTAPWAARDERPSPVRAPARRALGAPRCPLRTPSPGPGAARHGERLRRAIRIGATSPTAGSAGRPVTAASPSGPTAT